MDEKKMTLEELVGWLDDNDVSCEIDDAGKLTVKGDLGKHFRYWVGTCKYTSLPDELICVEGDLWLEQTSMMSLGNLTSVGGSLVLQDTSITSLYDLPQVGGDLFLDQSQFQFLKRRALQKVKGEILHWDQAAEKWIALSPDELEVIVAENERRESLHNTRGSDVDWDLYDR